MPFLAATFAIGWLAWGVVVLDAHQVVGLGGNLWVLGLEVLATAAPALSALVVTAAVGGRLGAGALVGQQFRWRVALVWYVIALLLPALAMIAGIGLDIVAGGRSPELWFMGGPIIARSTLGSLLGEELGWRGFALPRLLHRSGPLFASIALGIVSAGWQLPFFLTSATPLAALPFWLFCLVLVAESLLSTWLYVSTRGSVLIAGIYHAASNVAFSLLPIAPAFNGGSERPSLLFSLVYLALGLTAVVTLPRGAGRLPSAPEA